MIGDIIKGVGDILDGLFTNDEERAAAHLKLEELRQKPHLAQSLINLAEAKHKSVFVAGWRPFIGWACGFGVLWAFVGLPVANWVCAYQGIEIELPNLPTENIFEMVLAMLGMGGLRTYEKIKGKTK